MPGSAVFGAISLLTFFCLLVAWSICVDRLRRDLPFRLIFKRIVLIGWTLVVSCGIGQQLTQDVFDVLTLLLSCIVFAGGSWLIVLYVFTQCFD